MLFNHPLPNKHKIKKFTFFTQREVNSVNEFSISIIFSLYRNLGYIETDKGDPSRRKAYVYVLAFYGKMEGRETLLRKVQSLMTQYFVINFIK